jgi:hypothetical protein
MFEFLIVHQSLPKHLFISSFIAFLILNFIENFIHYNTGKYHDTTEFYFEIPSKKDLFKIIFIMIIFAILQGLFTLFLFRFT